MQAATSSTVPSHQPQSSPVLEEPAPLTPPAFGSPPELSPARGATEVVDRPAQFLDNATDETPIATLEAIPIGERIMLTRSCTVGRSPHNGIILTNGTVSKVHARLRREGDIFTVEDLASRNGTRINGKHINEPQVLDNGNRVMFGDVEFLFVRLDPR